MYRELIKKYISFLKIQHIKEYANRMNIILSEEECLILYQFIKDHYLELLDDNTTIIQLKSLIREDLYQEIDCLYQENKAKYL